jgi:outer membrane protein
MKRLLKVLPIVLLLASTSQAQQATRTAYIDAAKIITKLPEAQDAESRLDQLVASWNQEADNIQSELNRKKAEFERRKLIMTDAERSATEVDVQNVQKRLNEFRQAKYGPQGELYSQQASMMKPAYDKLMKAIEEVARDGNYDYVLDKSSKDVAVLYSNSKHDITVPVAKKLGIETDVIMQPLLNSPSPSSSGTPSSGARPSNPREPQSPAGSNPRTPGVRTNDREPIRQATPDGNVPVQSPVTK